MLQQLSSLQGVPSGVFLASAAERLPNSRRLDEAEGTSPDGAECD